MRKIIPILLFVLGFSAFLIYVLYANRERRFPEANMTRLNDAETQWYAAGIQHYQITVEVEFAAERRRHIVTVQNGQVTEATLSYLVGETWTPPEPVGAEFAGEFTVPGLFNALRFELNQRQREDVRVDMNVSPAYPRYMYFGPVWLEGEPMASSEARFTVVAFVPLSAP
ncbi:MAG: hypothetical protein HUU38_24500 [Anaerolineales bacterium]|nr:hypothetical protein [Anaerolineales bacterium]